MKCPTQREIPAPPEGKKGWPWAEESRQLYAAGRNEKSWPLISIVTPSYNQDRFIEETIRSVLLQDYPNIEYLIIDGNSSDNTQEIIKKYEKWLTYWVSEPDNGQSEAINKGWAVSNGDILAWLNSDDTYTENALISIAEFFIENPHVDMIYGDSRMIDEKGHFLKMAPAAEFKLKPLVCNHWFIPQQSTFIRRSVFERVGKLNEDLHLVMDWEYWLRIALNDFRIQFLPKILSNFRIHKNAKTSSFSERSGEEKIKVLDKIFSKKKYFSKISQHKKPAYCYVHKWTGQAYFSNAHKLKALMHFMNSVRYGPYLLKNRQFRKTLVSCISI